MITRKSVFQLFMAFSLACGGLGAVSVLNAPEAAAANTCGTSYRMVKDGRVPVEGRVGGAFRHDLRCIFRRRITRIVRFWLKEGPSLGLGKRM